MRKSIESLQLLATENQQLRLFKGYNIVEASLLRHQALEGREGKAFRHQKNVVFECCVRGYITYPEHAAQNKAHYSSGHTKVAGLIAPTQRLVYDRRPDLSPIRETVLVSIEISDIEERTSLNDWQRQKR